MGYVVRWLSRSRGDRACCCADFVRALAVAHGHALSHALLAAAAPASACSAQSDTTPAGSVAPYRPRNLIGVILISGPVLSWVRDSWMRRRFTRTAGMRRRQMPGMPMGMGTQYLEAATPSHPDYPWMKGLYATAHTMHHTSNQLVQFCNWLNKTLFLGSGATHPSTYLQ